MNVKQSIDQANRLRKEKRFSRSLRLIDSISVDRSHPLFIDSVFLRGDIYCDRGDYTEALKCYTQIIKLLKSDVAYNNRGYCLVKLGRKRDALVDYGKALRLNSVNLVARRAVADLCIELEESQKAKRHYLCGIKIDPEHSYWFSGLGHACFLLEDWRHAYLNFAHALKLNPADSLAQKGLTHLEDWFQLNHEIVTKRRGRSKHMTRTKVKVPALC